MSAVVYSQATVYRKLEKLHCIMWVGEIVVWGTRFDDLVFRCLLTAVGVRNLSAIAHRRILYNTSMKWCGKMYPGEVAKLDKKCGPQDAINAEIRDEDMSHEPVAFPS